MAHIVINDLEENVELDRAAMRRITGGRSGQQQSAVPVCESALFPQQNFFDLFNFAGSSFNPNRG